MRSRRSGLVRMRAGRVRWLLFALGLLVALVAAGCGSSNSSSTGGGSTSGGGKPVTIGASLPLSGDLSQPGKSAQQGYQIWLDMVNGRGGLLGRQVKMKIVDDASSQKTIVTDYNRLIAQDHVDLLLGTFSSLLNLPASAVAEKNRMVYVEPAGGAPEMFSRGSKYLFFAQPATAIHQADLFSKWVLSLPPDKRPKTAAYISQDDPFAKPVVQAVQKQLSAGGVKTVEGPLRWDQTGAPQGQFLVAQWQGPGTEIVQPTSLATSKTIVFPKPN